METTVKLEALKPDLTFKSDLLLDKEYILLPAGTAVTEELVKTLKDWNFKDFLCEDEPEPQKDEIIVSNSEAKPAQKTSTQQASESVREVIANMASVKYGNSERSRMDYVHKVYDEYMNYINSIYTHYATHKKIDLKDLTDNVQNLCIFIKEHKRYVLRITPSAEARSKNFLVIHSMRSTVLAITLGMELHLPLSKLIELGIACILHEIGMLRLPPQLYMTDKALSQSEKAQIMTHTILGFNIVKELDFPLSIQLGVLEHHEKENGMGYPRQLEGKKISIYAKIISVACSFEAITSPRDYKTERTTFDAMVEMLKNSNKQYDETVIKALLYSLSLFPIGAYVYLNNGKIGIVTDVAPNNPRQPIIQILNEYESDGSPKTVQADSDANKIVRVLTRKEEEDVLKAMALKETKDSLKRRFAPPAAKPEPVKQPDSKGFSEVDLNEFN